MIAPIAVLALYASVNAATVTAFITPSPLLLPSPKEIQKSPSNCGRKQTTHIYNILDAVGDFLTGGKLEAETDLPYSPPFSDDLSISSDVRTFAVRERAISFTGEDFDISHVEDGSEYVRVRGAMLHLPGKDKMRMYASNSGKECVVLDRVLMAATQSFDLYRAGMGAEKIGWIEKKLVSIGDVFDVYMEGKGGFGVTGLFKPTPAYRIEGDFLDRNFAFRNAEGRVVAKCHMDGWIQFDEFNHYQVQVAPGMDALLVLACVCAIDEEFDEEHKKRKE